MKVLLVNSLYYPNVVGGAERSVQLLAESLAAAGDEIVVLTTSDKTRQDAVNGIKVHYLSVPNLYWMRTAKSQPSYKKPLWHIVDSHNMFATRQIGEVIRAEHPDVVHTNNLAGLSVAVWVAAADANVPIVHTVRDHYLLCARALMFYRDRLCTRQCTWCKMLALPRKSASKLVDGAVGVSQFMIDKHRRHGYFPNARVVTHIYNSVGISTKQTERRREGDQIRFGYVGQLAPAKGIEFLLKVFTRSNLPGAKLFVYGRSLDAQYEAYLQREYAGRSVEFMGHRDIADVYPGLDVVVIPSLCDDAFPRTLIESYSFGVPVIATIRGGASEMIVEGETGYLFDPSADGQLEDRLRRFVDDPDLAARISPACREITAQLSGETVVSRYRETYRAVMR